MLPCKTLFVIVVAPVVYQPLLTAFMY